MTLEALQHSLQCIFALLRYLNWIVLHLIVQRTLFLFVVVATFYEQALRGGVNGFFQLIVETR